MLHCGWFVVVVSILSSLEGKRIDYVSRKLASNKTLASTDSEQERREEEPTIIVLPEFSSLLLYYPDVPLATSYPQVIISPVTYIFT